jgi:hypothetical protein
MVVSKSNNDNIIERYRCLEFQNASMRYLTRRIDLLLASQKHEDVAGRFGQVNLQYSEQTRQKHAFIVGIQYATLHSILRELLIPSDR